MATINGQELGNETMREAEPHYEKVRWEANGSKREDSPPVDRRVGGVGVDGIGLMLLPPLSRL